jgi:ankyrin repeat protein
MLLRWITYAQSPRTLHELAEATIIGLGNEAGIEDVVDVDNRGGWADTLAVLAGLVTIQNEEENDDHTCEDSVDLQISSKVTQDAKVRLAHFSVQEFLESTRILGSHVEIFHLNPAQEHRFLVRSCLAYLHHYSSSSEKCKSKEDLQNFPLLEYASKAWFYHASMQQQDNSQVLALSLLGSEGEMHDWLTLHQPDRAWREPFRSEDGMIFPNGLYYASYLGLRETVKRLLEHGANVNTQGGEFDNALCAASSRGHAEIVRLLLDKGADIHAQGGEFDNALCAASWGGNTEIVRLLLDKGADIHAQGDRYGNALCAASWGGQAEIVRLLLDKGADIHAQGGRFGNALCAASWGGNTEIVRLLLDKGADIHAQGGSYGNALCAASSGGHAEIVRLLLDKGADIHAQGGSYGNALFAALTTDNNDIVALLLEKGFRYQDIEQDLLGRSRTILAACYGYLPGLEQDLTGQSAVNAVDNHQWTALHWAAYFDQVEAVDLLLRHGASSAMVDWQDWTARDVALFAGHERISSRLEQPTDQSSSVVPGRRHPSGGYCDSCGHVSYFKQQDCKLIGG